MLGHKGDGREPDGAGAVGQGGPDCQQGRRWQGTGGPDDSFCGWWSRKGDGREPDGVEEVGQGGPDGWGGRGWQGTEGPDGSFFGWWGRRGMARWGRGSGGKEGQKAEEGGDGRVQEGQMAVAGAVGGRRVAGDRSSIWGQSVTRSGGKGQLEARGAVRARWGLDTEGRMVAVRHWGGIPDSSGGVPDRDGGIPDRDGGIPDRDGGISDRGDGVPDMDGGIPDIDDGIPDMYGGIPDMDSMIPDKYGGVPDRMVGFRQVMAYQMQVRF